MLFTLWQLFETLGGTESSVRSCVHPPARGIIKIQIETRAIVRENPARSHETKPTDPPFANRNNLFETSLPSLLSGSAVFFSQNRGEDTDDNFRLKTMPPVLNKHLRL